MDLTPAEVVGHTCYHFVHVEDLENLRQSHEDRECALRERPQTTNLLPLLSLAPSADEVPNPHPSCLVSPAPSAAERSGGDRLLPLAAEEGRLPVDPVHRHRLH